MGPGSAPALSGPTRRPPSRPTRAMLPPPLPTVKLAREPLVDGADVAGNPALDERVDEGRHRPLVLAVLREHVGRDGHVRLWQLARDDLAHTPLVVRVGVGVDEADADRGQPLLA